MSDSFTGNFADREYLSPHEFVARSGLSLATVRRYLRDGRIPSEQPGGHRCRVLIPRSALAQFSAGKSVNRSAEANRSRPIADSFDSRHKSLPGRKAKWRSQS